MNILYTILLIALILSPVVLLWWAIGSIDKCYKAGCTLADPDGSRSRERKRYYGS